MQQQIFFKKYFRILVMDKQIDTFQQAEVEDIE